MKVKNGLLFSIFMGIAFMTSCTNDQSPKSPEIATFDPAPWIAKGMAIQKEVFAALSSRLTAKLSKGGPQAAIPYCNLMAYPLTDSLSDVYRANIRRATLQPRNPLNRATAEEADILSNYSRSKASGEELQPVIMDNPQTIDYYSPIVIQSLCLACHGTAGKEVSQADIDIIRKFYPADAATGYALGDLRGIWHISFTK